MRRSRKAFITSKEYGRMKSLVYYPHSECNDIDLEPLTIRRMMNQIQVELLKPVEFCGAFGIKHYDKGIHSLDRDLAHLLVRIRSARFLLPRRPVPIPKASRH